MTIYFDQLIKDLKQKYGLKACPEGVEVAAAALGLPSSYKGGDAIISGSFMDVAIAAAFKMSTSEAYLITEATMTYDGRPGIAEALIAEFYGLDKKAASVRKAAK